MGIKLVYIPAPPEKAKEIARALVGEKLAACCNLIPIESIYWWKGEVEEGAEVVVLAKTLESKLEKVINRVKSIHQYEVPCILVMNGEVNEEYREYMEGAIG